MHYKAAIYLTVLFIPILNFEITDTFSGSILQLPKCGIYFENSERQEFDKNNLCL